MDASEDLKELEGSVELTNDWESDDLDFSSDFEVDTLHVEERNDNFKPEELIHANCVDRETFEKEKQTWQEAMEEMSQRFSRATSMLDSMKSIALRDQERIEELERENKEILQYKETFTRLQQQIEGLNTLLYESNEESASYRQKINELKDRIAELEDKLYGPTNYYYQEFLRCQDEIESLQKECDSYKDQLYQVKNIMRDMIIEREKGPTQEDLLREREKFAKQVSALERRIEQLQEENEKLQVKQ